MLAKGMMVIVPSCLLGRIISNGCASFGFRSYHNCSKTNTIAWWLPEVKSRNTAVLSALSACPIIDAWANGDSYIRNNL